MLGHRVPARHPLIVWLVRHAAHIATWIVKGPDGLTAYRQMMVHAFHVEVHAFHVDTLANSIVEVAGTDPVCW